jgi:hypothetical protein
MVDDQSCPWVLRAVVELQQTYFGQGNGSGVFHPDGRPTAGASGMRKAHAQKNADRGYPVSGP